MEISQTLFSERKEEAGAGRKAEYCPVETATDYLAVFFSGNPCNLEGMDLKIMASSKHCGVFFTAACCAYSYVLC